MLLREKMNVKEFYDDLWTSSDTIKVDQALLSMRKRAIEHSYSRLGNVQGKKILEIGCGTGMQTVEFARRGALVTAIDISPESVQQTRKMAREEEVEVQVLVMNGEQLALQGELFDIVYIDAVLMHADSTKVVAEAARVCKEGGKVLVLEPLRYNPFSLPYRLLFSPYRKTRPTYMTIGKFKKLRESIPSLRAMNHQEFYFFSVLLFPLYREGKGPGLSKVVERIDSFLIRFLPFLNRWSWITVVEYRK